MLANKVNQIQKRLSTAAKLLAFFILFFNSQFVHANLSCTDILKGRSPEGAVLSTTEILGQLSANAGQRYRENPKLLNPNTLQVGQDVFVTPLALKGLPSLAKRFKDPIKMRVVQIKDYDSAQTKKSWKKSRKIIYLDSQETGQIGVESWRLSDDVFSEPDFALYSSFEPGEYVQIGSDYSSKNEYKTVRGGNDTFTFSGNAAQYIGRFVRIHDEKNYVISVKSIKDNVPATEIIVPRSSTYGLTSGTLTHFQNTVKGLLSMHVAFKYDELVRFRRSDGTIAMGTFVRVNSHYSTVKDEDGKLIYVSPQSVFRYVDGEPFTAIYNADWIQANFENPSSLVRQLLDGAGKLSSLSDFAEMSNDDKIKTLMKYLKSNVSWTKGAISAETAGLDDFNEIICSGAGVCRHLAVLMATMLSEAGFSPRVVKYIEAGKDGHAWVEVDVRLPNGHSEIIVVDPSNGDYVANYNQVAAIAGGNKTSFEASWYTKPGREYIIVQPHN
jgi:hypothetical protein